MKIDEAVATKMPQIIAAVNEWMTGPPKKNSATSASSRVSDVMIVRASVWLVARSMTSRIGICLYLRRISRMRSKMTTVSLSE